MRHHDTAGPGKSVDPPGDNGMSPRVKMHPVKCPKGAGESAEDAQAAKLPVAWTTQVSTGEASPHGTAVPHPWQSPSVARYGHSQDWRLVTPATKHGGGRHAEGSSHPIPPPHPMYRKLLIAILTRPSIEAAFATAVAQVDPIVTLVAIRRRRRAKMRIPGGIVRR